MPDWLSPEPKKPSTPTTTAASLDALGSSAQEQEDAVSWLESLASKHGAKPEELVTDPNSRSDIAPEWVNQVRDIGQSQPASQDEMGAWLSEQNKNDAAPDLFAPKQDSQKPAPDEDRETSDWLASLAGSSSSQPSDWQHFDTPLDRNATPLDDKPLWDEPAPTQNTRAESMVEQSQEPIFKETPLQNTPASTDLPDWLRGLDNEPQKPAVAADNIPSWLSAEEETSNAEFRLEPEPEPVSPADWHPVEPPTLKMEMSQTTQPAPAPVQPKTAKAKPAARPRQVATSKSTESALEQAQNELSRGDIPSALEQYTRLIKKGRSLDEIIRDLRDALYRYPVEVSIWQTLGDAYMRSNRLQEALDAYTKAEELLR
jgi:hypothetical protein